MGEPPHSSEEAEVTRPPAGTADTFIQDTPGGFDETLPPEQARGRPPRGALSIPEHRLIRELGRGGMGVVYLAEQTGLGRQVAIKTLLPHATGDAGEVARFRAEGEAVAALRHPNIVQIFEVGEAEGRPWFALEFVEGETLSSKIRERPLSARRAAEVTRQIAEGVAHAHAHGIVHRDLKPGNVLLTGDGVAKVTDFGLVKRVNDESHITRTGTIVGTPSFMAPEQARGDSDVGPAADVYALGSVLYAVLTGRPPFLADTAIQTITQVIDKEPVPPSRLQPQVPRDLETVCLKCLRKVPADRYAAASEVSDELGRFLRGVPIHARPVSRTERVWRWAKRNPAMAAVSAVAAALALAVMIGGPTAAVLIEERRQAAEAARGRAIVKEQEAVAAREQAILQKSAAERYAELAEEEARRAEENAALASRNEDRARQNAERAEANAQRAEDSAARAARQRNLAVDALGVLVTEVQRQLDDRPGVADLRRRLLETALSGLDRVTDVTGADSTADVRTAQAHRRMGDIYADSGRTQAALEQYEACHRIIEALAAAGTLPLPLSNTAASLERLADLEARLGRPDAARAKLEESLRLRTRWVDGQPNANIGTRQALAIPMSKRASLEKQEGRTTEAADWYGRVRDLRLAWVEAEPRNGNARRELAGTQMVLGDLALDAGQFEEAVRQYRRSQEILRSLARRVGDRTSAQTNAALADRKLATALSYAGELDEAVAPYTAAIERLTRLHAQEPSNVNVSSHLAIAHYQLGVVHRRLGREGEAAAHPTEAIALREAAFHAAPGDTLTRLGYAVALARGGRHTDAALLAAETSARDDVAASHLIQVACVYAQAAAAAGRESEEGLHATYLTRAFEAVRRAADAGHDVQTVLQTDWDLDPLRGDKRFQELAARTAATGGPPPQADAAE